MNLLESPLFLQYIRIQLRFSLYCLVCHIFVFSEVVAAITKLYENEEFEKGDLELANYVLSLMRRDTIAGIIQHLSKHGPPGRKRPGDETMADLPHKQ